MVPKWRPPAHALRDESFIASWGGGGGYIRGGGVGKFFGDVLGDVENKMTYGRGGGHVFRQVLLGGGGSDVFHWSSFSLKVIASGGGGGDGLRPQTPCIPAL